MSRQDKFFRSEIDDVPLAGSGDDDRLLISLRLGLEKIAAVEEEMLRSLPRRRPSIAQLTRLAAHLHKARQARSKLFKDDLFGEPAWDMLLALYYLPKRGEVLTVTTLSLAADVAPTTGLRWQKTLLDEGLIKRGPHILDGRQQLVGLTDQGRLLMAEYLTRLFLCSGGLPETD